MAIQDGVVLWYSTVASGKYYLLAWTRASRPRLGTHFGIPFLMLLFLRNMTMNFKVYGHSHIWPSPATGTAHYNLLNSTNTIYRFVVAIPKYEYRTPLAIMVKPFSMVGTPLCC